MKEKLSDSNSLFKRDVFGNFYFIKRILIFVLGIPTYYKFNIRNKTEITGSQNFKDLDYRNVLIVSNHQTYFADVASFILMLSSVKWGFNDSMRNPVYLLNPKLNLYYVAAEETMKSGFLPRIFMYAGAIPVKRTWRAEGQDVARPVDAKDTSNIGKALSTGWVITFPQGTTKAFAEGRKGTAHIIKEYKPIVIPININGFRRAFDKKGLKNKVNNVDISIKIKAPLNIDYDAPAEVILKQVMDSIEQSDDFNLMKKLKAEGGK